VIGNLLSYVTLYTFGVATKFNDDATDVFQSNDSRNVTSNDMMMNSSFDFAMCGINDCAVCLTHKYFLKSCNSEHMRLQFMFHVRFSCFMLSVVCNITLQNLHQKQQVWSKLCWTFRNDSFHIQQHLIQTNSSGWFKKAPYYVFWSHFLVKWNFMTNFSPNISRIMRLL